MDFKEIKKIVGNYPKNFLKGIYESEGCLSINFNKRSSKKYLIITIVSCEKPTINLTKLLIEQLGLHPRLNLRHPNPPRKPIWALNLGKQDEIKRFLYLINPCIKTKHKLYKLIN